MRKRKKKILEIDILTGILTKIKAVASSRKTWNGWSSHRMLIRIWMKTKKLRNILSWELKVKIIKLGPTSSSASDYDAATGPGTASHLWPPTENIQSSHETSWDWAVPSSDKLASF